MRRSAAVATAVITLALTLTACGGAGAASTECDTGRGTLTLGLVAPLSGELANIGAGMRNSADLAVRQANQQCLVPGYRLELDARDDHANASIGAQAARVLAADPTLIGVVGTYNSSTAQAVQPVLGSAGIVQISPGNTNVSLTRGANPVTAPLRQYQTYFRVVATDAVQGPLAANYLAGTEHQRVAVISDGNTYGEGIASEFSKQFQTRGGQIVLRQTLSPNAPASARDAVVAAVTAAHPQAVFYGGEYPAGGPLAEALAGAGGPVMGGDGLVNAGYGAAGGRDGDLGTSVGAPPETQSSARPFLAAYRAAGYREGYGEYGAFSFDAANVLLSSVASVVNGRGGGEWSTAERPAVDQAVQSYSGDGATGAISFDRFGDVDTDAVAVYRLVGGRWIPERTQP